MNLDEVFRFVAPRRQDLVDVVELVKIGANVKRVRAYIERNEPALLDELTEEAEGAD
jgi:hypothetical protein